MGTILLDPIKAKVVFKPWNDSEFPSLANKTWDCVTECKNEVLALSEILSAEGKLP